jgi:hypothetical protein
MADGKDNSEEVRVLNHEWGGGAAKPEIRISKSEGNPNTECMCAACESFLEMYSNVPTPSPQPSPSGRGGDNLRRWIHSIAAEHFPAPGQFLPLTEGEGWGEGGFVLARSIIERPGSRGRRECPGSGWAASVVLTALLGLWLLCSGCGKTAPDGGPDFSKTNSVTILLGEVEKEYGTGLQHIYHERDGLTTPAMINGVPCRHLKRERGGLGYLYFIVDPAFKRGGHKSVSIEIEYLAPRKGTLGVQYDASQANPPKPYMSVEQVEYLSGAKEWKTALFYIRNASFANAQNGGADFRFVVSPPELYVRRVTVTRDPK